MKRNSHCRRFPASQHALTAFVFAARSGPAVTTGLLLFLFLGFALTTRICADTHYIDYSSGSDLNDGLSPATSWKHCPGDANATGNPAAATLSGGSTLLFKGGVVYQGQIVAGWPGSPGNPIVYDGNSAGSWGSGKAILDGANAANGVGFRVESSSNISIMHFEIRHFGGYGDLSAYDCTANKPPLREGTGIFLKQVSAITVRNNCFREIGIWQNTAPVQGDVDVSGIGISLCSGTAVTIAGNEFTRMSTGISAVVYFSSPMLISQVTISGNDFHDFLRWPICCGTGGDSATLQDITISGNSLHNYTEYGQGAFCGDKPHVDGIIMMVGSPQAGQNCVHTTLGTPQHPIRICNNIFEQDGTADFGTSFIFLTTFGGTVYIHNNLFANSLCGDGCIYVQDGLRGDDSNPAVDYHFWNNTICDSKAGIFLRSITPGNELDRPGYQVDIRNNLLYSADTTRYSPYLLVMKTDNSSDGRNHCAPTIMDYNSWFVTTHNPHQSGSFTPVVAVWAGAASPTGYSIPDWNRATGFEQQGRYGDPQFADFSYGIGPNSSRNNFALQSTSPDVDNGTPLGSYFATDLRGVARPQGPGWDRGAFEFEPPLDAFSGPVEQGWNIVSLNIHPVDSSAAAVFGDSDTQSTSRYPCGIFYVKDLAGRVYCPALGICSLDSVHTGQGYQLCSDSTDTIRAWGRAVDAAATPIALQNGWNLIAYLPQCSMPISTALAGIDSALDLVKNNLGEIFWPRYGIDNIGLMKPGQGYFAHLRQDALLVYPAGAGKTVTSRRLVKQPALRHFAVHRNTGSNATFLARSIMIGNTIAPDGCEVAVCDQSGKVAGAGATAQGVCAFPVWGDEGIPGRKTGCATGEKLAFALWTGSGEFPLDFIPDSGIEAAYSRNAIITGRVICRSGATTGITPRLAVYPNPFRQRARIEFTAGGEGRQVQIEIYDLKGNLVERLAADRYGAGQHELVWNAGKNGRAAGAAMFVVCMKTTGFEKRVKICKVK